MHVSPTSSYALHFYHIGHVAFSGTTILGVNGGRQKPTKNV